jgi:hypothetical protein
MYDYGVAHHVSERDCGSIFYLHRCGRFFNADNGAFNPKIAAVSRTLHIRRFIEYLKNALHISSVEAIRFR